MIGVVAPDADPEPFVEAAESAGVSARAGAAGAVAGDDSEAIVAVGESALIELVRADAGAPVLPVEAGSGVGSVTRRDAIDSMASVLDGEYGTRRHPVLDVSVGDERAGSALFDAMLVTSDPGRISEFGVETDGRIDRFRADGVVVATPAGSHGYANAAGGPLLDAGTDVLAVVPVSAFEMRSEARVLAPPVTLSVERDEDEISLLLDDREQAGIPFGSPVRVSVGGEMSILTLDRA